GGTRTVDAPQLVDSLMSLSDAFVTQAERTPHGVAVRDSGSVMTYEALNNRANQWSRLLKQWGVQRGECVAIIMGPSAQQVITILGILKIGATYVPIDPIVPAQRVEFVLRDCRARVVVTKGAVRADVQDVLRRESARVLDVELESAVDAMATSNPAVRPRSDDAAYVIYTSR